MRDHPKGAALLAIAQKTMRERILPVLPPDIKHDALMILNAMSIAMRQLEQGEEFEREELQALAELLGNVPHELTGTGASALVAANRTLSQHIRSGASAPSHPQRAAVFAHLVGVARQRVRESNPKYLKT